MPYWRHLKSQAPSIGQPFGSMVEARDGIDPKLEIVTFEPTVDETGEWHSREIARFNSGEYLSVPWLQDCGATFRAYNQPATTHYHFPHRSVKSPGLIAYTKNDEHGGNDRQTSVRPGRYLEEFFKDVFTPDEIAAYANRCKAETLELKIARSEAEIVKIYSLKNCGFSSCMQLKLSPEYDWQRAVENGDRKHPVAVYGDSDLGVAYLGDIDTKITARCVVWPDRKQFTRVYGDTTLTSILQGNGYRKVSSLDGARVRYIESGNGVIMPYIDGVSHANIDPEDDKFIRLGADDDGSYQCRNTSGYGDDSEDPNYDEPDEASDDDYDGHYTCERCNHNYTYGSQRHEELNRYHCSDCLDQRQTCDRCHEDTWDDLTRIESTDANLCEACYNLGNVQCANMIHLSHSRGLGWSGEYGAGSVVQCGNTFHTLGDFDETEQADRETRHVSAYCATCAEHKQLCQHCGQLFDDLLTQCTACTMAVRCTETPQLPCMYSAYYSDPDTFGVAYGENPPVAQPSTDLPVGVDGSQWWRETPGSTRRCDGHWVKFADGATYYTPDRGVTLNYSSFDTLDGMTDHHIRVPDPRPAINPANLETVFASANESPF